MNKNLPNKWIRKAIFQAINNIVVDGKVVRCYDTNVSGVDVPNNYVILSTQSNIVEKANKCEYFWNSEILLDIVNIYQSAGNMGDRLLTDNITDEVRKLTDVLILDSASNLSVISQIQSFPNGLNSTNDNQIIFRNFIRISLRIK